MKDSGQLGAHLALGLSPGDAKAVAAALLKAAAADGTRGHRGVRGVLSLSLASGPDLSRAAASTGEAAFLALAATLTGGSTRERCGLYWAALTAVADPDALLEQLFLKALGKVRPLGWAEGWQAGRERWTRKPAEMPIGRLQAVGVASGGDAVVVLESLVHLLCAGATLGSMAEGAFARSASSERAESREQRGRESSERESRAERAAREREMVERVSSEAEQTGQVVRGACPPTDPRCRVA
jgi:hypothetical protein